MSELRAKARNFKQSIAQNGIGTEIRRMKNYMRHKKTVLDPYAEWMLLNEPDEKALEKQKQYQSCLNTKFVLLVASEQMKEQVTKQTYANYEIKVVETAAYSEFVKHTDADYCIFIGDKIQLLPFTLYSIEQFLEYNECHLIYADNDFLQDGKRVNPELKPHFAYDTLLSKNYFGNFIVAKTKFLQANRDILENLSDTEPIYHIILRALTRTRKMMHIDTVLYHKLGETINTKEQIRLIEEYLKSQKIAYEHVENGRFVGQYKIQYTVQDNPLISIIIPNMDHIEDLDKAITSILTSTYRHYEIIVVENNSKQAETFAYYEKIQKQDNRIQVVSLKMDHFNYSQIVNFGVSQAKGTYVVLLNNDIEVITKDWLEQMLMFTQRQDVGICGVKLYFSDRSIQHAGVTIGVRGLAGHKYREVKEEEFSALDQINYVQDMSAVTAACCMIKKQTYQELLGFDEKLAVAFNDVDFCLKVRKAKLLIVYNPFVELYHYESKSRGMDDTKEKQKRFAKEYELFVKRWRRTIQKGDPYFNINYRLDTDIPTINYNKIR